MTPRGLTALTAYAAAILAANWLTTHHGIVPIGFGLTATAGTYAAGLALLLRDAVQDHAGHRWVFAGIATGAALTALLSPSLALASAAAFALAECLDWAIYTPLRSRGWARAALLSGIAGAIADTALFLWLAPFPFTWPTFYGQLAGKALWATLLPVLVIVAARQVGRGRVLRHTVRA